MEEIKQNRPNDFDKPKKEKIKSKTEDSKESPSEVLKKIKNNHPDK